MEPLLAGAYYHQRRDSGDVTDSPVLARLLGDLPRFPLEAEPTPIMIDDGPACPGVWRDGGAFRKIIAARMPELDRKGASEYRRARLEPAKAIRPGPDGVLSEWCDCLTVSGLLHDRFFVAHPKLLHTVTCRQRRLPLR